MRRLPLLVLLYVGLDFANPLMPGAVRFEGGGVECVQADRVARAAAPALPGPAALGIDDPAPAEAVSRPPPPGPAVPRPARRDVRRLASGRSGLAPSSEEDH
jgi:hypothetical protein